MSGLPVAASATAGPPAGYAARAKMRAPRGFELVAPLGQGLLTETFRVRAGARSLVCKRLIAGLRQNEEARTALEDEARVLAALDGRGAPRLVDSGADGDGPYLAMEWVEGGRLRAPSRGERLPPMAHVEAWTRAAFAALAVVHGASDAHGALRVLHGDLRPDNVLLRAGGADAVLVDFGLATFRNSRRVEDGTFRGTGIYAAPEAARSEPQDDRSDVFALAATLLHVASGEAPRPSLPPPALLVVAAEQPIEAYARRAAARLPPTLAEALLRCTAFRKEDRPEAATVAAL